MKRQRNYIYKGNTAYEYKTCPKCEEERLIRRSGTYCSNRCSRLGRWKDSVTYRGAHRRVEGARGKASTHTCKCGVPAMDWASLTGNYPDPNDYEAMCRSCHRHYDNERVAV